MREAGGGRPQPSPLVARLTRILESLPLLDASYKRESIPENGIYIFYEKGEAWPDESTLRGAPRVVRIGSHRADGNFRTRMGQHFNATRRRSTFRYHLGAAIAKLTAIDPAVIDVWEDRKGPKLVDIETAVTKALTERFQFRCLSLDPEQCDRLAMEAKLISTFSAGNTQFSGAWLGNHSPRSKIRNSGLWNSDHVFTEKFLTEEDIELLEVAVSTDVNIWSRRRSGHSLHWSIPRSSGENG